MNELLTVENVSFSYGNNVIFDNISLSIKKGEIFCLLGPNGSGKSTLLNCILGLLPIKNGTIKLYNKDISSLKPFEIARNIAYVEQLHTITFPYKVLDIVLMGRAAHTKFYASPCEEDYYYAEEALSTIGISELKNYKITELSGGQKQLVMIAQALAQQTSMVVMDEPTAHLDLHHELHILEKINQLVDQLNISVLMTTHFPNHSFYYEDHLTPVQVAVLHKKQFYAYGPVKKVLSEDVIHDVFKIESKIYSHQRRDREHSYIYPVRTVRRGRDEI